MIWRTGLLILLATGIAGSVAGQVLKAGPIFQGIEPHERVVTGAVASATPGGLQLSPWTAFAPSGRRSNWAMMFDSMSFNLDANVPYSGVYGQTRGFFRFSNQYKNDLVSIDIEKLAPGTAGLSATRFITDIVWNPGGTYAVSGSGRLAMAVFCAQRFGSADNANSLYTPYAPPITSVSSNGLIIDFGVQQAGWRTYDVDLTNTGFSIPLPAGCSPSYPAALVIFIGTIGTNGQFQRCPQSWAMQPTLDTMAAPNDPNYPGINPSQSGPLQWDDDGGSLLAPVPNGRHDNLTTTSNAFTEIYNYDWSGSNGGYVQASAGLFYQPGGNRFSGRVTSSPLPGALDVTMYATNGSGQLLPSPGGGAASRTVVVPVASDGTFSLADPKIVVQGGGLATTAVIAYGGGNGVIRRVTGPISLTASSTFPNVTLPTGDIDSSGEVDAADIDAVIAAFGRVFGAPNWDPSRDPDGSGEVDAADIDIVIANFGASNSPPPNFP